MRRRHRHTIAALISLQHATCALAGLWSSESCTLRVQVDRNGWVNLVHSVYSGTFSRRPSFAADNGNRFRVAWSGAFPTAAANCSGHCTVRGSTCMCDVAVEISQALSTIPSLAAEVEAACQIGSLCPTDGVASSLTLATGTHELLKAGAEVDVYRDVSNAYAGGLNVDALFRVKATGRCYLNKRSTVRVGSTGAHFLFRNAPHFVSVLVPTATDAAHEIEALLDHLFEHPNVAPFVAHRFIQRFTTSNPSPRYVEAVSAAFTSGRHGGVTYTGKYGDLGAMIAAILLDREARSVTLDADPSHGVMREPLLKLHHVLRSLEFASRGQMEIEMPYIYDRIGMQAHSSPSVFNFYQHDYQPRGLVAQADLYAPEAGLATGPLLIGFLNGMTSLIKAGLTACQGGFGRRCRAWQLVRDYPSVDWSDGSLALVPEDGSSAATVIAELDLLLTSGRLNANASAVIADAYDEYNARVGPTAALVVAQQLLTASAEFHATNMHTLTGDVRRGAATGAGDAVTYDTSRFKAVVVLVMDGGADTYNLLMPYGDCSTNAKNPTGKDMHAEYTSVRSDVAVQRSEMIQVQAQAGSQPCDTMGIHYKLPTIASLYEQGQAAFVANIGNLIEPTTRESYLDGTVDLPPQNGAHNVARRSNQNLHPQNANAKGVLGRMLDEVGAQESPFLPAAYSIAGNAKIIEALTVSPDIVSASWGAVQFYGMGNSNLELHIKKVLAPSSTSVMGETIANLFETAIYRSNVVGKVLDKVTLSTAFATDELSKQFQQVAKLINSSAELATERGVYYVQIGGFGKPYHPHLCSSRACVLMRGAWVMHRHTFGRS